MSARISDESLMLNHRDGDLLAFNELYQRYSHGLYLFIARRSPRKKCVDLPRYPRQLWPMLKPPSAPGRVREIP